MAVVIGQKERDIFHYKGVVLPKDCVITKNNRIAIFLVLSVFVPECILCWILSYELFILKMPPLVGSFEC